jgi:hypothetical protein
MPMAAPAGNRRQPASGGGPTPATNDQLIAIWSKAVDTQMHFNEMSVKSRQLGLTFVAAALALAVVLMSQNEDFSIQIPTGRGEIRIHVAFLLTVAAILGILSVKKLDLTVYHRMLRGAVSFGEDFERNYMKDIFSLDRGMTGAISHFSRYDDADVGLGPSGGKYIYSGTNKVTAEHKIRSFYAMVTWYLVATALGLFVFSNWVFLSGLFS